MKIRRPWILIACLAFHLTPSPLLAGDSPEVIFQVWVEASRAGNMEKILALSSAAKVKEFHQEITTPEKQAEIRKLIKLMAPKSYTVKKSTVSPDGNQATLFLDAIVLDFFSLNDSKAKPQKENMEVRLVKEGGEWKIDQQCSGKEGCGVEPEWQQANFGKAITLPNQGSLKVAAASHPEFKAVKLNGKAYSVDFLFDFPENTSLFYFLHRSPTFAEFYLQAGDQKITPTASLEIFAIDEKEPKQAKLLEADVSYSQSRQFAGKGILSLLFDLPADAKGAKDLRFIVKVNDQKLAFQVK